VAEPQVAAHWEGPHHVVAHLLELDLPIDDRMIEVPLALPSDSLRMVGGRIVTATSLPWPMTWPMFCLVQACSGLPDTFAELRYFNQPTRTFRLPVAS
jgi:hypothetical protein